MLAERAAIAKARETEKAEAVRIERRWDRIGKALFARIDRAAPFIDDETPPDKWRASSLLKILYCVAATAERPEAAREAALVVLDYLDLARERWRAGFYANPFVDNPRRRRPG